MRQDGGESLSFRNWSTEWHFITDLAGTAAKTEGGWRAPTAYAWGRGQFSHCFRRWIFCSSAIMDKQLDQGLWQESSEGKTVKRLLDRGDQLDYQEEKLDRLVKKQANKGDSSLKIRDFGWS
jgi:hypothetical protein